MFGTQDRLYRIFGISPHLVWVIDARSLGVLSGMLGMHELGPVSVLKGFCSIDSLCMMLQPVVYMGIHVVLCWAATLTAMIWWHSKTAHTLFLIFCASVSAWNGKTCYIKAGSALTQCSQQCCHHCACSYCAYLLLIDLGKGLR